MMIRVSLTDHATNEQGWGGAEGRDMWISQARILKWLPFPSPGDLPDAGIEPMSPALQVTSLLLSHQSSLSSILMQKKKKAYFLKPLAFIHHPIPNAAFETSLIYQASSCLRLSVYFPSLKTVLMSLFCLWSLLSSEP